MGFEVLICDLMIDGGQDVTCDVWAQPACFLTSRKAQQVVAPVVRATLLSFLISALCLMRVPFMIVCSKLQQ